MMDYLSTCARMDRASESSGDLEQRRVPSEAAGLDWPKFLKWTGVALVNAAMTADGRTHEIGNNRKYYITPALQWFNVWVRYSSSSTLLDVFISEDTNPTVSASLSVSTGVNLVIAHKENETASFSRQRSCITRVVFRARKAVI